MFKSISFSIFLSFFFIQNTYSNSTLDGHVAELLGNSSSSDDFQYDKNICAMFYNISSIDMTYRQLNWSAKDTIDKLLSVNGLDNFSDKNMITNMTVSIVKQAYQAPIYPTKAEKKNIADSFADQHYLLCMELYFKKLHP